MLKKIKKLINEYFKMETGEYIENYLQEIVFCDGEINLKITRRALKHIVEQRKKDSYCSKRIYEIFKILFKILYIKNYQIVKNRDLPNTFLLIEQTFTTSESICIAIELVYINSNSYYIKTGFFRDTTRIKKLLEIEK